MSERKPRWLRALAFALLMALAGAAALAESVDVELNAATMVYSSLNSSARRVKAPKGLQVSLRACAKGWGRVVYKGKTGYVRLKYLDRLNPLRCYVTRNATVYRDGSGDKKLTTVARGTAVYALGVDGGYVRIMSHHKDWKGYIRTGVLTSRKPAVSNGSPVPRELQATAEGARASKIEKAIYVAQRLVGMPCAEDPNPPRSFDSPGYVSYCYGKAWSGIVRSSARGQGYDEHFERIDNPDDLKRGDLVCFNTVDDKDLSDHVGIHLGKGYFLHASSVAKKVIVSQLKSGYYSRVFSWGRRIFS